MTGRTDYETRAAHHLMTNRFAAAATSAPPTDEQRHQVSVLQGTIVDLAAKIELVVPDGRNKELALTALEDVQMRANRGIFQEGPNR